MAEKPLKCFQNLEVTGGVKDPKKGRNRRRTPEERMNPTLKASEAARLSMGRLKAKEITAKKHRAAQKEAKAAMAPERKTRRRTKFDFDLWDNGQGQVGQEVKSNEWLDHNTKQHNLKSTGRLVRSTPKDLLVKPTTLSAVETPHGGTSYNPSYQDHQELLWRAAIVEMNKEKAANKIEFHTTRMFPDSKDAPTDKSWLKEMSEGLGPHGLASQEEVEATDEEEDEVETSGSDEEGEMVVKASSKLKTRQQRRKERVRKVRDHKSRLTKAQKKKDQDVFRVKTLNKIIKAKEVVTQKRMENRKLKKALKLQGALQLSANKFEEPEVDLKLTEELAGSLRELKPEGNILYDRYKSLQKRNVFETTVQQKSTRKSHRRKKVEKRSYKMPWEKINQ